MTLSLLKSRCTTPAWCAAVKRGGHLIDERQDLRRGERSIPPEPGGQRLAVQQLHREHDDVGGRRAGAPGRVLVAEHVVDATDVRVGHLSRQVHLALEPRDGALVTRDVRQDRLERDPLLQFEILRFVELAHAAQRQEPHDAEAEGDDVTGTKHGGPRRRGPDRRGDGRFALGRGCHGGRRPRFDLVLEQSLDPEMRIDARDDLFRLDGLRDEIHRARFEPLVRAPSGR